MKAIETETFIDRASAISRIKSALERRSGKQWSVTGGTGTGWGWLNIGAPPKRRTWKNRIKAGATTDYAEDYEEYDSGQPNGHMSPDDRAELGRLLGCDGPVHFQGRSVAASGDHYREYVERAETGKAVKIAERYWD